VTNTRSDGMKFDDTKPDYSLVPFGALDEVVKVLTYGAKKYDRFNWEKIEAHRYQAAAMRHISAYMQGEKFDPETGINHMAHAICSLMFLVEFDKKDSKKDQIDVYEQLQPVYNGSINKKLNDVTPAEWSASAYKYFTNENVSYNYETK